jgi:hypothetical protein
MLPEIAKTSASGSIASHDGSYDWRVDWPKTNNRKGENRMRETKMDLFPLGY